MRHFGGRGWVALSGVALISYVAVLALVLLWQVSEDTTSLAPLGRQVALYAGLMLGVPTVALALLLFVRRVARLVAIAATVWLAFNAFVWLPVHAALAAWAAGAALVVLVATVAGWRADQVGSIRSRPQR